MKIFVIIPVFNRVKCTINCIKSLNIAIKEFDFEYGEEFVTNLMNVLDKEKNEGEKNVDFERRILKDLEKYVD